MFMRDLLQKILATEPARFFAAIAAVLGVAVSYGLLSQTRADAWVSFATLALPIVVPLLQGALTRRNAYSKETTQALANQATFKAPGTIVDIGQPPDASPPLPEGEG